MINIEPLIVIGEFLNALMHGHQIAAVILAVSIIIAGRVRWLLRLIMVVFLVALVHDAFTEQLAQDLK